MSRSGIAGSYGGFIPSFLRNLHTIFHSGYINSNSHQQCKSIPHSPTTSPAFIVCGTFDEGHSNWCEVISYRSFDFHFSNNELIRTIRIDAFELQCWSRLLRAPWTARRSNQSILKEISREYSLEGLVLKLKLQYFDHLMQRADSLEKTLMLGKIESRRSRE